ncbi:unnamed protein product [Cylicostephanus goldi]|uniref:Uncharacterized protein n=1 Tax=Cylicostephanus goldi TaxID=71465 RepID=A0A3P7N280_CYLGO|nr:unnamed protein product [Cylicostephanus goldi]
MEEEEDGGVEEAMVDVDGAEDMAEVGDGMDMEVGSEEEDGEVSF